MNVDPSKTTGNATSQPLLKIRSTNYRVQPNVDMYPDELKMLIVALNHSVLSWLSLAGLTVIFNKTTKLVTFQLTNEKKY